MANEHIERVHEASYHYCIQDAKKWRVNAAGQHGSASRYKVGDEVTIVAVKGTDNIVGCWKVAPPNPGTTIGHGIIIHVDVTMTIVCWKPIEGGE